MDGDQQCAMDHDHIPQLGTGDGTVSYVVASIRIGTARWHAHHRRPDLHRATGRSGMRVFPLRCVPFHGFGRETGAVAVATAAGCGWTAASGTDWITITEGRTGSGPGAVEYSLAFNAGANTRTGAVTIAGLTFTVTQESARLASVTSVNPGSAAAGSVALEIVVEGDDFAVGSVVRWNVRTGRPPFWRDATSRFNNGRPTSHAPGLSQSPFTTPRGHVQLSFHDLDRDNPGRDSGAQPGSEACRRTCLQADGPGSRLCGELEDPMERHRPADHV